MRIFQPIKRRVYFLAGMFATALAGIVGDLWHANYSKDDSLLVPTAHADLVVYTAGGSGDGSGGCSDGSSDGY